MPHSPRQKVPQCFTLIGQALCNEIVDSYNIIILEIIILILLWICQFLLIFLWFLMCSLPFLDSLSAGLATLQWFTSSGVDPILAQVFVTATSRTCFVNMLRKHIIINSLNIPHFISSLSWCPCNVEVLNC